MDTPKKATKQKTTSEKPTRYEFVEEEPTMVEEPFAWAETLVLDHSKRYTYADYLTWFDDIRRELINGFIHIMSAPVRIHAKISTQLTIKIYNFIDKHKGKCQVYHAPFDVRLPKNGHIEDDKIYDVVQPDVCVICDLSKLDYRGCIGAPDLMVEVLSPSTSKKDKTKKFKLYEKSGVREYWIVDPDKKTVHVFTLQPDGKYDSGTIYEHQQNAPVHIFEGLEIDLRELFEE
jgi:Uma2 family endonuclease